MNDDLKEHNGTPWRDEDCLREFYIERGQTTYEIADRFGCAPTTVQRWLNKHNIEHRHGPHGHSDYPWRDEDELRRLYVTEELSSFDIADRFGCDHSTICKWLGQFNIETRDKHERPPTFDTDVRGYERWRHGPKDDRKQVKHHRLLAVSKYGFDAVTPDKDVHHRNGIPWDNRYENIELVSHANHPKLHSMETKA